MQTPHRHTETPAAFPTSGLDGNACRNPIGEPRPWCYTTDPDVSWDYCSLCLEYAAQPATATSNAMCARISDCPLGASVLHHPTATSDRVCELKAIDLLGGFKFAFDGTYGVPTSSFTHVGDQFTLAFMVTLPSTSSGYLVAKTDNVGARFFSILLGSTSGLSFIYRVTGVATPQSVRVPLPGLFDGQSHQLMVVVDGLQAKTIVDGAVIATSTLSVCRTFYRSCHSRLPRACAAE